MVPRAIFGVREEREAGAARGIRPIALGRDAAHGVLIDLDTRNERELLSDALAAESWVAAFHLEDGVDRLA
jgi:hypothetical protein